MSEDKQTVENTPIDGQEVELKAEVAHEVTTENTESTEEVKAETVVVEVPEGREAFIQSDKVEINPRYAIILSGDATDPDTLSKVYPNPDSDPADGVAYLTAAFTSDMDTIFAKEHIGPLSNVITGKDEEGNPRATAVSRSKPLLNGSELVGEEAVLAITSSLGLGQPNEVPLVNSGFRVKIGKADGDDLMVLDEQLLRNKGEFGRMTIGSSMAFTSVYLQRDIVNTILRLVKAHNLEGVAQGDIEGLRNRISHRDYPALLLGLLAGTNPEGLHTNTPCTSEDADCKHITTGFTLPPRMFYVDHGKLTDKQLEIITRPMSKLVSDAEWKEYRREFESESDYYEFIKGEVRYRINYQNPSIENNIRAGVRWATNINNAINRYISGKDLPEVRKRVVNKALNTNTLTQFGGWIGSIELFSTVDDSLLATIRDQDTIISTLRSTYESEGMTGALEEIRKFIYNKNPLTVGVPNYTCSNCNKPANKGGAVLIPVDIEALFFIHCVDPELQQRHYELMDLLQ